MRLGKQHRVVLTIASVGVIATLMGSTAGSSSPTLAVQGSATATLTVHAHVVRNCEIQAFPIDFGNYDPLVANRTQPLDVSAGIVVRCTKNTAPRVELDVGQHAQGTTRRLSSGTEFLTYELYSDAARATVWGAGAQGTPVRIWGTPTGPAGGRSVFGRVPGGQNVSPGDYDDTVTATVIF